MAGAIDTGAVIAGIGAVIGAAVGGDTGQQITQISNAAGSLFPHSTIPASTYPMPQEQGAYPVQVPEPVPIDGLSAPPQTPWLLLAVLALFLLRRR